MESASRANNTGLWASFVGASSENNFGSIRLNEDLFNSMAMPACFKQCARMDIDITSLDEMNQTYKCMITYKQTLQMLKELNHE